MATTITRLIMIKSQDYMAHEWRREFALAISRAGIRVVSTTLISTTADHPMLFVLEGPEDAFGSSEIHRYVP